MEAKALVGVIVRPNPEDQLALFYALPQKREALVLRESQDCVTELL
jgi:hypothetical protein